MPKVINYPLAFIIIVLLKPILIVGRLKQASYDSINNKILAPFTEG